MVAAGTGFGYWLALGRERGAERCDKVYIARRLQGGVGEAEMGARSAGDAGDVGLQLADGRSLGGDDPVHQVPNRDDARDPVSLQHRQMAEVVIGHQPHAFLHRLRRGYMNNVTGKDFLHRVVLDDLPLITTLRV